MKIQQMIYFTTVCECGGLRNAAEILGISQSTLSIAIQHLEKEFEVPLFYRQHRHMVLTEAGEYYQAACRKLLAEFRGIPGSVLQMVRDRAFEIAFSPALGAQIISMGNVLESLGGIDKKIRFQERKTFPSLNEMMQEGLDLYCWYTVSPFQNKEDGICRQTLCQDKWVVSMADDNPLAQSIIAAGGKVSVSDLKNQPDLSYILYGGEDELFQAVSKFLADTEKSTCDQLHTLFAFLHHQQKLAILPSTVTQPEQGLCSFPLSDTGCIWIAAAYPAVGLDTAQKSRAAALIRNSFFSRPLIL